MNILFYRYNSICESSIISAWKAAGFQVTEITEEMENKNLTPQEQMLLASGPLQKQRYDFVFSINFFPVLSEVCNIFKTPYACWIVDSPVLELYSDAVCRPWNRIFLFDRELYHEFAPKNPDCIFYLPLASDVTSMSSVCDSISPEDVSRYSSDISFVASLYTEKCPYNKLQNPPDYLRGYLEGIIESQLKVYGYNFIRELVTDGLAAEFKKYLPGFYQFPEKYEQNERAVVADLYLGTKVTEQERLRLLGSLSEHFAVDLYTGSDTSSLPKVCNKGLARTYSEMPKIFRLSRINLNMTAKSIKSALPLRIWDILACGGFVMTNYQSEIPEYFEIGTDLETYASEDELLEKCAYYLAHEDERRQIAENGFRKVKEFHSLELRLGEMLRCMGWGKQAI